MSGSGVRGLALPNFRGYNWGGWPFHLLCVSLWGTKKTHSGKISELRKFFIVIF